MSESQVTLGRPDLMAAPSLSLQRAIAAARRLLVSDAASWIVPAALLLVWQGASQLGVLPTNVLPAPTEVLNAVWRLSASGELCENAKQGQ